MIMFGCILFGVPPLLKLGESNFGDELLVPTKCAVNSRA